MFKAAFKKSIGPMIRIAIVIYVMSEIVFPIRIESRLKDLDQMEYNGEKFVMKEGATLDDWDLRYLKYGSMRDR